MNLPSAILFDHDGVLVASEPLHWAAWGHLLEELGIPYEESELRSRVGKTAPEILSELLDKHRPGWIPAQYDVHALARRKNDFFLASAQTGLRAYPGVRELLAWLRARKIPAAVVSNAKRRELEAGLRGLGLYDSFARVISRDDVQPPKPDPTPYLFAAAELGVDPARCLGVEDSPTGLEALLMGKIPAAAVMTNFPAHVLESCIPGRPDLKPIWIGESIVRLSEWLRSLPA